MITVFVKKHYYYFIKKNNDGGGDMTLFYTSLNIFDK